MNTIIELDENDPFVKIPDINFFNSYSGIDHRIHIHQMRQGQKYKFFMDCFDFFNEFGLRGDYFEFGIYGARTFKMVLSEAKRFNHDEMNFYAFDSFLGLPESDPINNHWKKNSFSMNRSDFLAEVGKIGLYEDRIKIIQGYYEESLSKYDLKNTKPILINIDCDLESSSETVLSFIDNLISPGTIIYLDDIISGSMGNPKVGQYNAWNKFRYSSSHKFESFLQVGWWGKSYIVI